MANLVAPEVPQPGNMAKPFLSAFIASAGIANKRRQLEDHMMQIQAQDQLKQKQLDIQASNYASLDASRQSEAAAANVRANTMADKANKVTELSQRQIDFQDSLNQITADPGTTAYRTQLNIVRSQFPDVMATIGGKRIWDGTWNNHALISKETIMGHAVVVKDFDQQMRSEKLNPYYLENPNQWVYIDNSGKETTDSKKAVARSLKFGVDAQGYQYPLPPTAKSEDVKAWKTLPVERFDNLVKQHQAYKGVISSVITGAQEPDPGAAVQAQTAHKIKVKSPDGTMGLIPNEQLSDALKEGYQQVP